MDTTIRNLDPQLYRRLKHHAATTGRSVGQVMNEAMRSWLERIDGGRSSLADWSPEAWPEGSERLSEELDAALYDAPR